MRKLIVLLISCICLSLSLHAQTKFFTTDNGLSSSLINKIYQDRNGMVWIATEDGLNRYDGSKITIYKHDPIDKNSLCHNFVSTLFEDREGRLFVGTYNGIQMYNPETDKFSDNAIWNDGKPFRSDCSACTQLRNGEIWLSGNVPCKLRVEDGELIVSPLESPVPEGSIEEVMEDAFGRIWLIIAGDKICKITTSGHLVYYMEKEQKAGFVTLCEDAKGDIYAGSLTKGLMKYNEDKNAFIPINSWDKAKLPVMTIYADKQDKVFVGTDGRGMKILDKEKGYLTDFTIDLSGMISERMKVHSIMKDKDENLWVAIYQKGVVMIPASRNHFQYYGYKSTESNFIGSNCITAMYKDNDGKLWVGTDNDGLYGLSDDKKENVHYCSIADKSGVPSTIMSLFEDSEKNLWVGAYNSGLGILNRETGKFRNIRLLNQQKEVVERVYDLAEDNEKRLWIATMGNGIFCYDIKRQQIRYNDDIRRMAQTEWTTCLHYSTANNKLYIGSYDGIGCTDLKTNDLQTSWSLRRQIILDIYEGRNGNLWLGTSDGLVEWDINRNIFTTYTMAHGLPSNAIYGVQGDKQECLWLSTNAGLAQFNIKTREVTNYYVTDGLQGNEFSKGASYQDKEGNIYFGGINGITYFSPKEIVNPNKSWNVRITDFYVHNRPIRKGSKSGKQNIIDCAVYEAKTFNLGHMDNNFSIELSTVELNAPERITYSYVINDNDWTELPKGINYISFNDLNPGSYRFSIKAIDNTMESEVRTIQINIRSPWWYTWWAIAIYAIVSISLISLLTLYVRRKVNNK